MRVQCRRHRVGADGELPRHTEMNDQVGSLGRGSDGGLWCAILFEEQDEEFAAALHFDNAAPWGVLFDRGGVVDKIRLAQANAEYATTRQQRLQAADDSFDFGKFRQASIRQNGENAYRAARAAFEFDRRG